MAQLTIYSKKKISEKVHTRAGEKKLGEKILYLKQGDNWVEQLKENKSKYAIIGIPEDIGVRANFGRPGTASAWNNFLDTFLNIQHNHLCKGDWFTILGEIDVSHEMQQSQTLNPHNEEERNKLFDMVTHIDNVVAETIKGIVQAGKTPIIIGGGHNNAYGNIKGLSQALGTSVNAINFDAHTDFRPLTEGRHSGNGFSYALNDGFLHNYFIFGIHENYLSTTIQNSIKKHSKRVKYISYEDIAVRRNTIFEEQLFAASTHIEDKPFVIEIDLDSLPMIASSAITPSGFSIEDLRHFTHYFAQKSNASYLHICEGAPTLASNKNPSLVGKLITYIVTDFVKA